MILDTAFALIFSRQRVIGFIAPDVVLREVNRDELIITDHPVETGATISDHAFKRPKSVEMQCGWSDSTVGSVGYIDAIYQALLSLQAAREPFFLSTGKRSYFNMLIESLIVSTDEKTENVLMVSARFREVIITSTQQTATPSSAQANPASNGSTTDIGQQQAKMIAGGATP